MVRKFLTHFPVPVMAPIQKSLRNEPRISGSITISNYSILNKDRSMIHNPTKIGLQTQNVWRQILGKFLMSWVPVRILFLEICEKIINNRKRWYTAFIIKFFGDKAAVEQLSIKLKPVRLLYSKGVYYLLNNGRHNNINVILLAHLS